VVTSCGNYYVTARRHPDNEAKTPRRCWTSAMLGRLGRFFKLSRQHKVVLTSFHPSPSRLFRFPPSSPTQLPAICPLVPAPAPTPCVHSVPRRFLSGLASGCTNSYSISSSSSSSSSRRSWAMRSKDAHSSQPVIGRFPSRTSALWLRLEIRFMIIFIHHEIWQYNNKQITREKLCYLN